MSDVSRKIPRLADRRYGAVAIGASTGAPKILEQMLKRLPADMSVPILVAQHMPPKFTGEFARRLDRVSALTVVHAEDGMPVYPGVVYLARGREHMRVVRGGDGKVRIEINGEPEGLLFFPSADELLRSCALAYDDPVVGVVMTGIGSDGTEGALAIREAGGVVVTQSEETCAVYGMPKSCEEAGASDASLGPDEIVRFLLQLSPAWER